MKNKLKSFIKIFLWLLPLLVMVCVLLTVIPAFAESGLNGKELRAMYLWAFFIAGLTLFIFFYGPALLIRTIRRGNDKRSAAAREEAARREQERWKQKEEENKLRKMKYKRIKCPYCGTNNELSAVACKSCGAPVQSDQSKYLDI